MATKPNKAKSKRRSPAKSKARRIRSKPLLAEVAQVRRAPRRQTRKDVGRKTRKDVAGVAAAVSYNPALTMFGVMGRLVGVYAELPGRLAQCRSPMDLWLEQVRFTQRVFGEWQPKASR